MVAAPFTSLFVHTHDVSRSLKLSADGELAHALHQTLHFALDGHPDDWALSPYDSSNSGCHPLVTMPSTDPHAASLLPQSVSPGSTASTDSTASTTSTSSSIHANANPNPNATMAHLRVRPGFFPTSDAERPYKSFHFDPPSATLTLPHPITINKPASDPCSSDLRSAYEITAKFFYLDSNEDSADEERFPAQWVDDALRRLEQTTGLTTLDTFVLAFPTLDLDGQRARALQRTHSRPGNSNCECAPCSPSSSSSADAASPAAAPTDIVPQLQRDVGCVMRVWQSISRNAALLSLGLSDISQPALEHLFDAVEPKLEKLPVDAQANGGVAAPPMQLTTSTDAATVLAPYTTPAPARRPRVVTINVQTDPCGFDRSLSAWCRQQGMVLVANSDRRDPLPSHTLPTLFKEFHDSLPHPLPTQGELKPKWVLKYTTLIRDRGVVADKGYILFAQAS
ncbi:hypothetical protein ACQY0O_000917 [Thecaphora frezii]